VYDGLYTAGTQMMHPSCLCYRHFRASQLFDANIELVEILQYTEL